MNFRPVAGPSPWTLLLLFSAMAGHASAAPANKEFDCKGRVERCERKKAVVKRPVCGTDNISYPHRCALLRVRCFNDSLLRVKHRGRCKEKQPCWVDQTVKTGDPTRAPDSYMPRCKADGTYFRIQCHKKEGYCWCVTPAGKVLPNTIVKGEKPKCDNGRGKLRSRGSSRKGSRRECNKNDKATFVSNLVRIFKTEYNREQYTALMNGDRSLLDPIMLDKRAIEWKFGVLDADKSGNLTKTEYRDLKRLVRKVIKPKRCSRTFVRLCDTDHDGALSKPEWTYCFSAKGESSRKRTSTTSSTTTTTMRSTTTTTTTTTTAMALIDEYDDKDGGIGLEEADSEDTNDCLTDRQEALDDTTASSHVPECTSDGRYKRVQCYKSVGYCWCAQEDTGKPIPGTSVKDSNPKCDNVSALSSQPMKGCPEHKKEVFLKDLADYLRRKHSKNHNGTSLSTDYESIVADVFHSLDANHNKVLDRKEWKSFRDEMSADDKLRRCGKKLPRHCDANHDNRIGFTEWSNCLHAGRVQTQTQQPNEANTTILAKRRGPNPLESYLKGDD